MVQLPRFDFRVKIHPKPRGNWRPRAEIEINIKTEDCPWRPRLQGLHIWGGFAKHYSWGNLEDPFPIPDRYLVKRNGGNGSFYHPPGKNPFLRVDNLPNGELPVSYLHDQPERGKIAGSWVSSTPEDEGKRNYVSVVPSNYLEKDINRKISFYLPWRPGARPDYSDFMAVFKLIPPIIYSQLQDGLDSGESNALEYKGEANAAMFQVPSAAEASKSTVTRKVMVKKRR